MRLHLTGAYVSAMRRRAPRSSCLTPACGPSPASTDRSGAVLRYRPVGSGTAVPTSRQRCCGTDQSAAVLWLMATQGMEPLHVVRAELVGSGRRPLRVYPPWQAEPLSPGATDPRVVI